MTGFNALPIVEEDMKDDDVQWEGTSKISCPKWVQLPLLAVGLLGVQVLWSVEMSYGEHLVWFRFVKMCCCRLSLWSRLTRHVGGVDEVEFALLRHEQSSRMMLRHHA